MFKRILVLLLGLLLMMSTVATAEEDFNLLINPSFEDIGADGLPLGWYTDAYIKRDGVTQFSLADSAHSGQQAVQIENFDLNDARFAQTVAVRPNAMYRLSGWIKAADILDSGRGANLSVEGVYVFSESVYDTAGEWVYIETYGLTGDEQTDVTIFARVGGYSGESHGGTAAFDDLSLVEVEALPENVYADTWYTLPSVPVVDEPTADDPTEASPFWPWLIAMSAVYAIATLYFTQHLQLDRREVAMREASAVRKFAWYPFFTIVGLTLAALLRIFVALNVEGYQVDVNCFTAWGNTMSNVGPAMFYQSNWCDYTPGYIYVLGLNGTLAKIFSGIVSAAFVHKLIPMACDLIAACLIYRLAIEHQLSRRQAGILALLFAFNPAIILNSAAWCQIDSVLCVGLMLVAYFSIHKKWLVVLPVYVLCILVKPQALMLGFLGLAALIMEWLKNPAPAGKRLSRPQFDICMGVLVSLALALVIVLPFSPNQESPWWLIEQYSSTLQSYPYATVNTANLFYLFDANWDAIENAASLSVCIFFAIVSAAWCVYTYPRQHNKLRLWGIEPCVSAAYSLAYIALCFTGCTWTLLGVLTMSMAFALIIPMFVRSGKLEMLPLCGAVIFLLLYIFGIKMHERYLFPALFLFAMAYSLYRDKRILWLLLGTSCMLFINEGIVLDNSIRLGSSMGHLNADTVVLAKVLSVLNVLFTLLSVWLCHRICVEQSEPNLLEQLPPSGKNTPSYEAHPCTALNYRSDAKLGLTRRDGLIMLLVTLIYAVVALTNLGSTKAPQTAWKSSSAEERVYIDLGQHYENFSMLYFAQPSYNNFAVAVREDIHFAPSSGEADDGWSDPYPAQMAEGMCFSWQYLDPSYKSNDKDTFVNASDFSSVQKLSGRYVCILPRQYGLILNEVIFKDADGNIIPNVATIARENSNEKSPYYSDPNRLVDEQDTLEGEPSWWNSTYFDEIYHARTAFELLHNQNVYEWTHPPLGKIIMSWFIALFGMTPFGWRFAGALCGILMLPAMYLLAKQLTKRTSMATIAMLLMALDCMHFTQTRIATIDSYPVLFIILSYFFMLRFMQKDIVLDDMRKLLPDMALSGFFMGCGFASKWIGAYAGIGLAILYFWTCLRHLRLSRMSAHMPSSDLAAADRTALDMRSTHAIKRIVTLCLWCLLFFVAVPVMIYLLSYADRFADRQVTGIVSLIKMIITETEGMLSYHGTPGLGMDHSFYSPWYEWPLMITPMYYASASFKPEGMTYAIFCFGNPWVWLVGLVGIGYTVYRWARGHHYRLANTDRSIHTFRKDWDIAPAFVLIGLLAQFLPWVLVPRGTYIYHYFASVPFLILGTILLLDTITKRWPGKGKVLCIIYLALCLVWFCMLFPYASGLMTPEWWMDFIRDYPYLNQMDGYWGNDFLVSLNNFLEKLPIFPHVYHH